MTEHRYTGGDIILKALTDQDVDVVFGYPGGVTLPLYDRIYQQNKIRHILVGHVLCELVEQRYFKEKGGLKNNKLRVQ